MIYATSTTGEKIKPTPKTHATCPGCKGEVLAKCGSINTWHWAHKAKDCDSWHEPETEWHLKWKSYANPEHCEIVMGPHRADVLGPLGVVVEFQNSPISPEVIREREEFYQKMIWIVNAESFCDRLSFTQIFENDELNLSYFSWAFPRKSWFKAEKAVFLDLGNKSVKVEQKVKIEEYYPEEYEIGVWINRSEYSFIIDPFGTITIVESSGKVKTAYLPPAPPRGNISYSYKPRPSITINGDDWLIYVKQFNYDDCEPDNHAEWFSIHRCGFVKKQTLINKYFR
jgi:hypothetical protein